MNKFLVLTSALVLFGTSVAQAQTAAVVNGETISVAEMKEAYNNNPQVKGKVSFDEFYPKALEVFVNGKILLQAAKKDGIEDDAEYKKQVALAKEEIARKLYLEKKVGPKISDAEVNKLYEEYKKNFKNEKEVKAKHILVDSDAKAKEVIAKLKKGESFEKLATQYSKEPAELGYFSKGMMVPEFGNAAFAMKKGEVSSTPVKTKFGYHVIKVEDLRDSKLMPKKEIEPQLKTMLTQNAIGQTFQELYKNAKVEAFDAKGNPIEQKN